MSEGAGLSLNEPAALEHIEFFIAKTFEVSSAVMHRRLEYDDLIWPFPSAAPAWDNIYMSTTQPPKPKRRWCQFSLRTLLVVMTLFTVTVGCFVGWIQYRRQRARENRERVAAIEAEMRKVGGWVFPTLESEDGTWLDGLFNDPGNFDNFNRVGVSGDGQYGDIGLEHLKALPLVTQLHLGRTKVTDVGLVHLKGQTRLGSLFLDDTDVTDAGLVNLRGLTNLNDLRLRRCNITDAGLEHLNGLTNLRFLNLNGTNVTDEGIKKLQQALPKCKIHR